MPKTEEIYWPRPANLTLYHIRSHRYISAVNRRGAAPIGSSDWQLRLFVSGILRLDPRRNFRVIPKFLIFSDKIKFEKLNCPAFYLILSPDRVSTI